MERFGFRFTIGLFLPCSVLALIAVLFYGHLTVNASTFTDLNEGDPYFQEVMFLTDIGAINGYPDGTFQAEKPVNRAEVLKMIFLSLKPYYFKEDPASRQMLLIGSGAATQDVTLSYPDVNADEWFFPYVAQATFDGMISGTPAGTYEPERTVNLAEMLKILFRNDNRDIEVYVKKGPYADVPKNKWFTRYFEYARILNLLEADAEDKVYPDLQLMRGEVARIIYKYLQAKKLIRGGVATFYGADFHGRGTASGEKFDMYAMTAAHKELPFNTKVKVINRENGNFVIVRINDRGPFTAGKDFDLSRSAFEKITSVGRGVINIEWQIVSDYDAAIFAN